MKELNLQLTKVELNAFYPIAVAEPAVTTEQRREWRLVWTGEKRAPKAEEFYLSGAIVEGYQAKHDMTTEHYIARIVPGKIVTEWRPL